MTNNEDVQAQIDELKKRLDAFNSFQSIPFIVDRAWKNRGFVKTDFFVAGSSSLSVIGESHTPIPGSTKYSVALVTPHVGSGGGIEAEMAQGYANNNYGAASTQFDITNPAGTTFRYTWDGNGTNPNINATTVPIGSRLVVFIGGNSANSNAASRPFFTVTGSGSNYFEIDNPTPGVAQNNITIGVGGSITGGGPVDSPWELYVSGTPPTDFSYVVFLFGVQDLNETL